MDEITVNSDPPDWSVVDRLASDYVIHIRSGIHIGEEAVSITFQINTHQLSGP